jgi:hypothetical protein
MFSLLVQTAHYAPATVQAVPVQVYVTVQQPTAGIPEWLKLLITVVVGALIGIISSIAMEYLKPFIAERTMSKTLKAQLADELLTNFNRLQAAKRLLVRGEAVSGDEGRMAYVVAFTILGSLHRDRFDLAFTTQKILLYKLDKLGTLVAFYKLTAYYVR